MRHPPLRPRSARIALAILDWIVATWWLIVLVALLGFTVLREGRIWGLW